MRILTGTAGFLTPATLLALLMGTAMPGFAQSAPTLTRSAAAETLNRQFGTQGCGEVADSVRQQGAWAVVAHHCTRNPDASGETVLHYSGAAWAYVCGHGDDVLFADEAAKKCSISLGQAHRLGFPAQSDVFDVSDPVQLVDKYYFLWNRHDFTGMYALLSASYRNEHPYSSWVKSHAATAAISSAGFAGTVTVERAGDDQLFRSGGQQHRQRRVRGHVEARQRAGRLEA